MGRQMKDCLRLKAVDAEDLSVIAACLQDALIPLREMVYLPDEHRFLAAFTQIEEQNLRERLIKITEWMSRHPDEARAIVTNLAKH